MAAENWSQPISKTFEQIVYFSTSVTGYQTNKKSGQNYFLLFVFKLVFFYFLNCEKIYCQISLFK